MVLFLSIGLLYPRDFTRYRHEKLFTQVYKYQPLVVTQMLPISKLFKNTAAITSLVTP